MKKISLLCVLALYGSSLFAQFASNWQVDFQDSPTLNYSNEGRKIITDANSNIFVLGDYSSDRDSAGHTVGSTQYTVRLQKYNFNGTLLTWVYIPVNGLITNGYDNRNSFGLEIDAAGNVYIGYSVYNASGNFDLVISKYSNNLTLNWTYVYATVGHDVGIDLKLNGTTAYAIVKSFAGANTTYSIVAARNGATTSVPLFSFITNVDVINGLITTSTKYIYVTGSSLVSGIKTVLTASVSTVGSLKWKVNYNHGSVTGDDYGSGLMIASDGNIYVVGTTYTSAANGNDGLLLKYNTSGTLMAAQFFNQSTVDVGFAVAAGPSGYIYAACSNATYVKVYKVTLANFLSVLPASYLPIPISSYTGITNVTIADMKVAASGNVYVCGYLDATSASGNFSASFLVKFGLNGFLFKPLNSQQVEGSNLDNYRASCMVLDGYKSDILVLRNEFGTYGTHAFESVNLMDYDGGTSLRLAEGSDLASVEDASVSLFPNPATDRISVRADENISSLEISDLTGKIVRSVRLNDTEVEIIVSDLNKGLYICKTTTASGIVNMKRLMVE